MTDGAALPLALSDLVVAMVAAGLIATTITAGHAFGGDLEAVSVPSALALARQVAAADITIVAMGPGVVGTGTDLGTTVGGGGRRARHGRRARRGADRGPADVERRRPRAPPGRQPPQSHTALDLTRSRVLVAVPHDGAFTDPRHDVRIVAPPPIPELLADAGLRVTTMGRSPADDPLFFEAAGAAGTLAGDASL